ncbi:MAG: tryptophan--tRNA ligase [Jatrophihabitans sp.]
MSRIVTGERPTGPLHLGHYFGTLANRIAYQSDGHELFVVIADYQVITDRDRAEDPRGTVLNLVLDYLAAGLDPDRTVVFVHSEITALHQLMLPFLSLVSVGELQRNPTVKDEIAHSRQERVSGLMFTYPVHQAADVLSCQGELVPVGRDQLPHVELMRTVARRFAERYAPVFTLPRPVLSDAPLLAGLDGGKMSKSRNNAIALNCDPDEVARLVRAARTDSERSITYDPARRPEIAGLLQLAAVCTGLAPTEVAASIGAGGAAALKTLVTDAVNDLLQPMRQRRAQYSLDDAAAILERGNRVADAEAECTLDRVRAAMGMDYGRQPRTALRV